LLKAGKVLGFLLLSVAIVGGSFVFLRDTCSLHSQSISAKLESRQTGADREEQKNLRTDPSATFELRVTEPNKIEGSYFSKNTVGEPSDWGHKFLCYTKIGEFAVGCPAKWICSRLPRQSTLLWVRRGRDCGHRLSGFTGVAAVAGGGGAGCAGAASCALPNVGSGKPCG
jgi:hypothetical protein